MAEVRPGVEAGTIGASSFRKRVRGRLLRAPAVLPWIAAGVAVAALAALGFAAGQRVGFERAARAAAAAEHLAPFRPAVQGQAARLAAERRRAALAVHAIVERAGALQADIVRMEARAG